jgi:hypothetical protein
VLPWSPGHLGRMKVASALPIPGARAFCMLRVISRRCRAVLLLEGGSDGSFTENA